MLAKKYGPQFTDEPAFHKQLAKAFNLAPTEDAHAIKFDYVNLAQLLEPKASLASVGMFANRKRKASEEGVKPSKEKKI